MARLNKEVYLYTCMIKADYLELQKLMQTPEEFILKLNDRYRKKAEELYDVAKLNYLSWRSINNAYFNKLFAVYVVSIEQ